MKVLVVDDLEINRKVLAVMLKAAGHETVDAEDGVEALARLRETAVDAIISDILMPRMDGYRFCYEVRLDGRFRNLPFIVYSSSYTSDSDEQLAIDVGADLFIRKPASPEAILEALTRLGKGRRSAAPPQAPARELDSLREYSTGLVRKLELNNRELAESQKQLSAAYEQLRRSEARYRALMEHARDAIFVVDTQGVILEANSAAEILHGGPRTGMIGRHFLEVIAPEDRATIERDFELVRTGSRIEARRTQGLKADGSTVSLEASAALVRVEGSDLILAIVREISAR